ncbi:hypothetical protein BLNAU_13156 [Blattamonas nauphoetae]|uniref:Uncharacterized protein n=1 Tax=Blattamonas nauphoetae TaxID=2049346 RepID=A0ABQ9XJK6_9EUKA|nr:hypothetical protein BLNAU_13156 [Blattamonas nauphoetae]
MRRKGDKTSDEGDRTKERAHQTVSAFSDQLDSKQTLDTIDSSAISRSNSIISGFTSFIDYGSPDDLSLSQDGQYSVLTGFGSFDPHAMDSFTNYQTSSQADFDELEGGDVLRQISPSLDKENIPIPLTFYMGSAPGSNKMKRKKKENKGENDPEGESSSEYVMDKEQERIFAEQIDEADLGLWNMKDLIFAHGGTPTTNRLTKDTRQPWNQNTASQPRSNPADDSPFVSNDITVTPLTQSRSGLRKPPKPDYADIDSRDSHPESPTHNIRIHPPTVASQEPTLGDSAVSDKVPETHEPPQTTPIPPPSPPPPKRPTSPYLPISFETIPHTSEKPISATPKADRRARTSLRPSSNKSKTPTLDRHERKRSDSVRSISNVLSQDRDSSQEAINSTNSPVSLNTPSPSSFPPFSSVPTTRSITHKTLAEKQERAAMIRESFAAEVSMRARQTTEKIREANEKKQEELERKKREIEQKQEEAQNRYASQIALRIQSAVEEDEKVNERLGEREEKVVHEHAELEQKLKRKMELATERREKITETKIEKAKRMNDPSTSTASPAYSPLFRRPQLSTEKANQVNPNQAQPTPSLTVPNQPAPDPLKTPLQLKLDAKVFVPRSRAKPVNVTPPALLGPKLPTQEEYPALCSPPPPPVVTLPLLQLSSPEPHVSQSPLSDSKLKFKVKMKDKTNIMQNNIIQLADEPASHTSSESQQKRLHDWEDAEMEFEKSRIRIWALLKTQSTPFAQFLTNKQSELRLPFRSRFKRQKLPKDLTTLTFAELINEAESQLVTAKQEGEAELVKNPKAEIKLKKGQARMWSDLMERIQKWFSASCYLEDCIKLLHEISTDSEHEDHTDRNVARPNASSLRSLKVIVHYFSDPFFLSTHVWFSRLNELLGILLTPAATIQSRIASNIEDPSHPAAQRLHTILLSTLVAFVTVDLFPFSCNPLFTMHPPQAGQHSSPLSLNSLSLIDAEWTGEMMSFFGLLFSALSLFHFRTSAVLNKTPEVGIGTAKTLQMTQLTQRGRDQQKKGSAGRGDHKLEGSRTGATFDEYHEMAHTFTSSVLPFCSTILSPSLLKLLTNSFGFQCMTSLMTATFHSFLCPPSVRHPNPFLTPCHMPKLLHFSLAFHPATPTQSINFPSAQLNTIGSVCILRFVPMINSFLTFFQLSISTLITTTSPAFAVTQSSPTIHHSPIQTTRSLPDDRSVPPVVAIQLPEPFIPQRMKTEKRDPEQEALITLARSSFHQFFSVMHIHSFESVAAILKHFHSNFEQQETNPDKIFVSQPIHTSLLLTLLSSLTRMLLIEAQITKTIEHPSPIQLVIHEDMVIQMLIDLFSIIHPLQDVLTTPPKDGIPLLPQHLLLLQSFSVPDLSPFIIVPSTDPSSLSTFPPSSRCQSMSLSQSLQQHAHNHLSGHLSPAIQQSSPLIIHSVTQSLIVQFSSLVTILGLCVPHLAEGLLRHPSALLTSLCTLKFSFFLRPSLSALIFPPIVVLSVANKEVSVPILKQYFTPNRYTETLLTIS